jgi:23S rRNA pseudouridine2457 synthase
MNVRAHGPAWVRQVVQNPRLSSNLRTPAIARDRRAPGASSRTVTLLNKPHGVLCQFSGDGSRRTLAEFIAERDVYPAGRLDADSEGLVVLTANGALQARIASPRAKLPKTYWVLVEGEPGADAIAALCAGVELADGRTRPAQVRAIPEPPGLWPRDPPIRVRRAIPTAWLEMVITEGRNRQVRRMTAAVRLPTLRLIRHAVGPWSLDGLAPGQSRREVVDERVLSSAPAR